MNPLHEPLGFRVRRLTDQHLRGQGAAERLPIRRQFRFAFAPPANRAFPIPHQNPSRRTQLTDLLPPPTPPASARPPAPPPRPTPPSTCSARCTATVQPPK